MVCPAENQLQDAAPSEHLRIDPRCIQPLPCSYGNECTNLLCTPPASCTVLPAQFGQSMVGSDVYSHSQCY